ncbi:TPA: lipopolysaccharide biosynthesis protein [Streptococcus suis]
MGEPMIDQNRENYIWNLLGSVSSALISTILLLIASRELGAAQSDIFSIVYSISQQFIIIGLFQVRNYQSTDASSELLFTDYLLSRIVTISVMLICASLFLLFQNYSLEKSLVYIFVILFRACDAFSDVYQGQLQQMKRSDLAGRILFLRSVVAIVIFFIVLHLSTSLVIASLAIFIANALLTAVLDFPLLKKVYAMDSIKIHRTTINSLLFLLKQCFPLFLNGFLITYIFTEPKLVIDQLLVNDILEAGMQRNFNILFMPTFILNLLFAVLRPMVTELAYDWEYKKIDIFYKKIWKISQILLLFGVIVIIASYFIGTPILSAVFGVDLLQYSLELSILVLAGLFNVFATMIDNLMTIFRKQKLLLPVYIATFLASKYYTYPMILSFGLRGAALSFLISMILYFVLSTMIYFLSLRRTAYE